MGAYGALGSVAHLMEESQHPFMPHIHSATLLFKPNKLMLKT